MAEYIEVNERTTEPTAELKWKEEKKITCEWVISRPINGLSLNGLEYVCDKSGNVQRYISPEAALLDLTLHGYDFNRMGAEEIIIKQWKDPQRRVNENA